jgi:hypothetical protein
VHGPQEAASAPQASRDPTQTPLASHFPARSQAVIPSSQTPFTLAGCAWQVPLAHVPVMQSLFRLVQSRGVLAQMPPAHTSVVQALPSVQVAVLSSLCWQPTAALQVSLVHGLLSLQTTGTLIGV